MVEVVLGKLIKVDMALPDFLFAAFHQLDFRVAFPGCFLCFNSSPEILTYLAFSFSKGRVGRFTNLRSSRALAARQEHYMTSKGKGLVPRMPRLYETEDTPAAEKLIWAHFFLGDSHWFAAEFDGKDTFFGYAVLNGDMMNAEW